MTEELYFKLVEACMQREGCLSTNAIIFSVLLGLITITICSGVAYYSPEHNYEPRPKFAKLFYPSTIITSVLLLFLIYSVRQCASYPARQDIDRIIRDLDKIKKLNTKTEENE